MKVIAIDPGYDRLGIAVIEKINNSEKLLFSECFTTSKNDDINTRNRNIGRRIRELVIEHTPDHMAIEGLFFSKNTKTALMVSETRGVIAFQASDAGIDIHEFTPNQIKLAVTGYGRASKVDVDYMVNKLIEIPEGKRIDDEMDAIAVGLTFFARYRAIG